MKSQNALSFFLVVTLALFTSLAGHAGEPEQKSQRNIFSSLWENLIFKREIILSGSKSGIRNEIAGKNSVGFEALKRFSGTKGDWGSVLCQVRLVRYDNEYMLMNRSRMTPIHVDGLHDWELEFHGAYLTYKVDYKGRLYLKIGHFDVPFGLEENVDTHTTLVQLMPMRNIGFKMDWGISAGGQFPEFDYNISLTRGSGMEYQHGPGNYLVSGRIGTPLEDNFGIGLSGLYGKPMDGMGVMRGMRMGMAGSPTQWFGSAGKPGNDIITRWRVGLDSIFLYGPFTFKGEISYGEDVDQRVLNGLLESDYLVPGLEERLELVGQFQYAYQDIADPGANNDAFILAAANYRFSGEITLQAAYRHDLERLKNAQNEKTFFLRFYFYF